VICATNRNLEREAKEGRFREELLYRINVITIALPALRERRDDIPLLANHFLRKYEKQLGRSTMRFSKSAMRVMVGYAWPGNVRELENTVERAAILAETDVLHAHDLPEKLSDKSVTPPVSADVSGMTLEELERDHIRAALTRVQGDKVRAAEALGIHLSTLYRKVQRYRLENVGLGEDAAQAAAPRAPMGRQ
jgi:DNA-binding NtrC family response regulator